MSGPSHIQPQHIQKCIVTVLIVTPQGFVEMAVELPRKLTPPQVGKILGVAAEKVIAWIRSGELRAIDVSSRGSTRPRYRIDLDDLAVFEERRVVSPARRPPRRTRPQGDLIEFF